MIAPKPIVLDANILLRAIFGAKVLGLLRKYKDTVTYYSPDLCFQEARTYVPEIAARRRFDQIDAFAVLELIELLVEPVDRSLYAAYERSALDRISIRDPEDWPIVATALLLTAPIWTEDQDFFGIGVATWTSDRVELYLRN